LQVKSGGPRATAFLLVAGWLILYPLPPAMHCFSAGRQHHV
jgi:hypothetical protein